MGEEERRPPRPEHGGRDQPTTTHTRGGDDPHAHRGAAKPDTTGRSPRTRARDGPRANTAPSPRDGQRFARPSDARGTGPRTGTKSAPSPRQRRRLAPTTTGRRRGTIGRAADLLEAQLAAVQSDAHRPRDKSLRGSHSTTPPRYGSTARRCGGSGGVRQHAYPQGLDTPAPQARPSGVGEVVTAQRAGGRRGRDRRARREGGQAPRRRRAGTARRSCFRDFLHYKPHFLHRTAHANKQNRVRGGRPGGATPPPPRPQQQGDGGRPVGTATQRALRPKQPGNGGRRGGPKRAHGHTPKQVGYPGRATETYSGPPSRHAPPVVQGRGRGSRRRATPSPLAHADRRQQ